MEAGGPVPTGVAAPPAPGALRGHLSDPLFRSGYLLIAGSGAGATLGFVFWLVAARSYTPEVVGQTSAAIAAMMLISGIASLGLNAVLVRYVPTAGAATRAFVARTYAVTAGVALVAGLAAALTSSVWAPTLDFLGDDLGWLAGFTLATVAWTIFSLQDSVLTGLRAAHWVTVENVSYSVAKLLLLVAVAGAMPVAGPFVAWNVPVGLAIAGVAVLTFGRLIPIHARASGPGRLDREQVLRVARGNYAGTLFSLAATILMPVVVANATDATQTAYFYVPWTISIGIGLIAIGMTSALTVEAAHDEGEMRRLTRRSLAATMRLVIPAAAVLAVASPLVLRAFGGDYSDEGSALLRLLAVAAVPNVVVTLGLTVARLQHRGGTVLVIQAAQAVLTLGLSLPLLPGEGIEAVGFAWLAAQLVVASALIAGMLRPLLLPLREEATR